MRNRTVIPWNGTVLPMTRALLWILCGARLSCRAHGDLVAMSEPQDVIVLSTATTAREGVPLRLVITTFGNAPLTNHIGRKVSS